jgi:hypothetical protein
MDWLDAFSPMKVLWAQKWMMIPYGSMAILLQGLSDEVPACSLIQLYHIDSASSSLDGPAIDPAVQAIVDEFFCSFC